MEFVDLKTQYAKIKHDVDERIQTVLDSAQFILGPAITELEEKLALRIGSRYCVSCASGTDALLLAMIALNIGPGDEVITSPFTFIATGEMIALLGAKPVFVDIDPVSYNLDASLISTAITSQTRAIMPVSLYGQTADMDVINAIAAQNHLPVIEDAAQSFGGTYKGRHSGNLSTIGCTSFFPSKPLGCYGDGGACFTNDEALAIAMRELRNHGQERRYHHTRIGINGRMDTLQAAIVLAKLEIFDEELRSRSEIAAEYTRLLKDHVKTPAVRLGDYSPFAQYTIEVEDRDAVAASLAAQGIPNAVHYPVPLHLQPAFASLGLKAGDFPHAEAAARRVLSLPMHPYLTSQDQARVAEAVRAAVSQHAAV